MRKITDILYAAALCMAILSVAGCGERVEEAQTRAFPMVEIPGVVTDPGERALFLAEHFWDDFMDTSKTYACDSSTVNGVTRPDLEQAFADYAGILGMTGLAQAEASVARLYRLAETFERKDTATNVFGSIAGLTEKYFYNPNSPFRNENLYLPFAEGLAKYDGFSKAERERYAYTAEMCSLNRIGDKASDFEFSDKDGGMHSLYGIEADYTLLFFSNPGCEACKGIIEALRSDKSVERLIAENRLAVVNVYIDEDVAAWYSYMTVYPDNWYNGYDPNLVIRTDMIYNVRAIPSLYVLDRDKTVLLKDAPENIVLSFIDRL